MLEIFTRFLVTCISLWVLSKILGKGLTATADGLFLTAVLDSVFAAVIFSGFAYLPLPRLIVALLIGSFLFVLPAFIFWFADRFVGGFKIKNRKYFVSACTWFFLIMCAGAFISSMLPVIGLGLFGLGSRHAGYRAHPGWFYPYEDYYYFYD
jgi:uncharacterized membrane protein YvlD (DUF360 family)